MANLIISNICDAGCAYCFAGDYMRSNNGEGTSRFMSLQEYEQALDYLNRSGIDEVRLLGGEPTLHPQFPHLIDRVIKLGKRITVFTHGAMPDSALKSLLEIPFEQCNLVVNMSAVFYESAIGQEKIKQRKLALMKMGSRAIPGFNIQSPGFDLSGLLETATETGMRKVIRLGLALPGPGLSNHFLHPKQYRLTGSRIVQQAEKAAQYGFMLDFDCGFVRCMFTEDELAYLQSIGIKTAYHCSPILDICSGNRVLHCFSLSDRFVQSFSDNKNASMLHQAFNEQTKAYRQAGIYQACASCTYKANQECSGGCLSATLRRFHPASFQLKVPDQYINS